MPQRQHGWGIVVVVVFWGCLVCCCCCLLCPWCKSSLGLNCCMKINVRLPRGGTSHLYVSVYVCVIVRHLGSANCHAPPRLPLPLQLWPLRVNYLVIIFSHNAQKFSSPLINWISHAQCGKPSLPPIGKHLSINLQNNAVSVWVEDGIELMQCVGFDLLCSFVCCDGDDKWVMKI